eukprot:TRINITY_DN36133_c0_g1_i1.p1 TRINITY_DN36133_c0_g1~~TRINITY_DN36133_c0_g1_i1.p1  ORF type:complete len:790 (-),score=159.63 TRINITY_DN36133_c0_g1_i1:46-2415(-)
MAPSPSTPTKGGTSKGSPSKSDKDAMEGESKMVWRPGEVRPVSVPKSPDKSPDSRRSSKPAERTEDLSDAPDSPVCEPGPDMAEWTRETQSNLSYVKALRQDAQARLSKGLQVPTSGGMTDAHLLGTAFGYTHVQDKLKRRVENSNAIAVNVTDRIEACEQVMQRVQQHVAELQRFSGILYASLSVAEKRIQLRATRPPTELVRDSFQEALEKEKTVYAKGRQQLENCAQQGREIMAFVEEVHAELSRDRHLLPQERSNRPQELLAKARDLEEVAVHYCSDIGPAARVREAAGREADRASSRTLAAMKKRVADLCDVRRQLENELKESSATLQEAEWMFARTDKMLKHLAAKAPVEQASDDQLAYLETNRQTFMTPLMKSLRARIKGASYIGHAGRKLDVLFQRFDKDGNGTLEEDEVRRALRRTLRISPASVSDAEIANLCQALDMDGSGGVSIDELVAFMSADVDYDSLAEQREQAEEIIESLKPAVEELQADLRRKTAAWKIDEACIRVTAIKGLELDAPPSHRNGQAKAGRPPGMRQARPISLEVQDKLRSKIKAAAYTGTQGRQIDVLFSRFDKEGTGELGDEELRRALRRTLRIPPTAITDQEIINLCGLLDNDNSGSVSIQELMDFVGAEQESRRSAPLEPIRTEERPPPEPKPPKPRTKPWKPLAPEILEKLKFKLKSAAYTGTAGRQLEVAFSRFDKDGFGQLEDDQVRRILRRVLRIPASQVSDQEIASLCGMLDLDNDGYVSVDELVAFVGMEPEVSRRSGKVVATPRKLEPIGAPDD